MKKSILLLLLSILSISANAQTATATLVKAPCNHDGILSVAFTGLTPPLTVYYHIFTRGIVGPTIAVHSGVAGLDDTLFGYSGATINIAAIDATLGAAGTYSLGTPPFMHFISPSPGICPAPGSMYGYVSGGTPPYTYKWIEESTMSVVGTSNPMTLPVGTYALEVTDAAGCAYSSLDDDSVVYLGMTPAYSITPTTTVASCTNGTAAVSVSSAAVLPISYSWSNGATTPSISGLTKGLYTVTVTDAIGCAGSKSATVTQSITISAPITPTPATCTKSDGGVAAFGSGGVPPYTYLWSNGATTASQSGIPGGYYAVAITDANGCIGDNSAWVSVSTPITVTYSTTPTSCTAPTGTATLKLAGGSAPYTTMWYTAPPQTGITATALAQGAYAFKTTDATGCVQTGSVIIPPVNTVTATFLTTPSICTLATGSIIPTPSGGAAPYSFAWSTGSTATSLTSVSTGLYHVTITDAIGCKGTYSQFLPFSSTLGVGLAGTNATCVFVSDGTLTALPTGGTTPYSYAWTGGGTSGTVTGLTAGIPYWVTVTDALGCTASKGTTVGADTLSSCYCTIAGTVYNDANGNCIQDPGEGGIEHTKINISGRGYTFTDASGHYSYKVPPGTYDVAENVLAYYPLSPCQTPSVTVTSVAGGGCILQVDFANNIDTIHDMHISTWDYGPPVPGHIYPQVTIVSNMGTVPETKVYTGYAPDGQLLAPTSIIPGTYFHGAPYWYSTSPSVIPVIAPGNSQAFLMSYNVPTDIPLGTAVIFKDTVTVDSPMINWLADYSPWNNVRYYTTNVVASFDPNFKEVYPAGAGPTGIITVNDTVLEYMVHFQNTGSYQAENIRVVDTLDDNLDWTTLATIFNSAAQGYVTVDISGPKKVATFMFPNINLPPVTKEPVASNGMFTYSIKTKMGLPIGTQFRNSASIYFDYNTPVKTNETVNTIGIITPTNVEAIGLTGNNNTFTIFPNPAGNTCNAVIDAAFAGTAIISITDLGGRTLATKQITVQRGNQTVPMNMSQLTPGVYFVSFIRNGNTQTQKLVIMK